MNNLQRDALRVRRKLPRRLKCSALLTVFGLAALGHVNAAPLVDKVEHIVVIAQEPLRLFSLFTEVYKLPIVWSFKDYGDFASGGVSLGNVALEFAKVSDSTGPTDPVASAYFAGFALQPVGDSASAVAELDRRKIAHSVPDLTYRREGWITFGLPQISPKNLDVFFCDYQQREQKAFGRASAAAALQAIDGGPLGVKRVKEIVLGVSSLDTAAGVWNRLSDTAVHERGRYHFGSGPDVRLVTSTNSRILGLTVIVKNLLQTEEFLQHRHIKFLNKSNSIDPKSMDGLQLTFVVE